jgi:hypothetical protein
LKIRQAAITLSVSGPILCTFMWRSLGGDQQLFYLAAFCSLREIGYTDSYSDQTDFMSNCDGTSSAGTHGEFANAALYIRSDPNADLAMLGVLSTDQDERAPSLSCTEILAANSKSKSGFYPLDPDGCVYCPPL